MAQPSYRVLGTDRAAGLREHGSPGAQLAQIVPLPVPARRPRGTALLIARVLTHLRAETAAEGPPPRPSSSSHPSAGTRARPSPRVRFPDDAA